MQKDSVRTFKNELKNYKYYKSMIVVFNDTIERYYERLGGVRGVDPSRAPTHSLPDKDVEYYLRDKIEQYNKIKARNEQNIKYIDEILGRIETSLRKAIINVYVEGEKMEKVASTMYLSSNGLLKRINKAIEGALDGKE